MVEDLSTMGGRFFPLLFDPAILPACYGRIGTLPHLFFGRS